MDHDDRIKSPSVERRKLIEQRMELISLLINQMNEGGNKDTVKKKENMHKRIIDCYGIRLYSLLTRFVNVLHRIFP